MTAFGKAVIALGVLSVWTLGARAEPNVPDASRPVLDIVIHSEMDIGRSAQEIWPHIAGTGVNQWMHNHLLHHTGPIDRIGEVFAAVNPEKPHEILSLVKEIEVVPSVRRTVKISTLDGRLTGYGVLSLQPVGNLTKVSFDLYQEKILTSTDLRRISKNSSLVKERQESEDEGRKQMEVAFTKLKRLTESAN